MTYINLEFFDFFIAPFYLIIIYFIAIKIRNRTVRDKELRKYYNRGLTIKIIGGVFALFIYIYYYGAGDMIWYLLRAENIYNIFWGKSEWGIAQDTMKALRLIFYDTKTLMETDSDYTQAFRFEDSGSYMVTRIGGFLYLFSFGSKLCLTILIAFISFLGIWKLFTTFYNLYPVLHKEIAISVLFIPSVAFWGSALFKDAVTYTALCWLTFYTNEIFINKKVTIKNVLYFSISFFFISSIKIYIILCYVPALFFWIFFTYRDKIKSRLLQAFITPIIVIFSSGLAYVFLDQMGSQNENWTLSQVQDRARDMQWWHTKVVELYGKEGGGGSFYSIGDGSFSLQNIIISFPLSVNVTLFRPYLWEARNPVILLGAIESLIFFILTLKIVKDSGIGNMLKLSIANPVAFYCLFFSIFFAFAVGFTSFNFGALGRYKIPCMSFYLMGLFIIRHHSNLTRQLRQISSDKALMENN